MQNFQDVNKRLKEIFEEYNITYLELERQTGIKKDRLEELLHSDLFRTLDTLTNFTNIKVNFKSKPFTIYRYKKTNEKNIAYIDRLIYPKFRIFYNVATRELFSLKTRVLLTDRLKEMYVNDVYEWIDAQTDKNHRT